MKVHEHGTAGRYNYNGCRCDECRKAWAEHIADQRRQRQLATDDERHGRASTYTNWGCRCAACLEAWRATQSRPRAVGPRPDRVRYARRLELLSQLVLGLLAERPYTTAELVERTSEPPFTISRVLRQLRDAGMVTYHQPWWRHPEWVPDVHGA